MVIPSGDRFGIISGKIDRPQRILIYGRGGIGKSTLASLAPNPIFIDIEKGTGELDVPRISDIDTFADLRGCIQSNALDGFGSVVLDSKTKSEEMSEVHVIANIKHEKGKPIRNIQDYGFSKGLGHIYDQMVLLLADLDSQIRRGRNVILIAHECICDAPNPYGEDYIRYEPDLQSPKSGKNSVRNRVVQWADHVLFVGYDVSSEDGKGKGAGTRTIYTSEMPSHVAKSRRVATALPFTGPTDGEIWTHILGGTT